MLIGGLSPSSPRWPVIGVGEVPAIDQLLKNGLVVT